MKNIMRVHFIFLLGKQMFVSGLQIYSIAWAIEKNKSE